MISILSVTNRLLIALIGIACIASVAHADDGDVGVSSSELRIAPSGKSGSSVPQLQGEYVIHNPTNMTIAYEVQWGSNGEWKAYTINPNKLRRHWHRLDGNGRAPSPYLRFDNRANDKRVTWKTYHINFGRVGYAGKSGNVNQAVHYEFVTSGNALDLVKR